MRFTYAAAIIAMSLLGVAVGCEDGEGLPLGLQRADGALSCPVLFAGRADSLEQIRYSPDGHKSRSIALPARGYIVQVESLDDRVVASYEPSVEVKTPGTEGTLLAGIYEIDLAGQRLEPIVTSPSLGLGRRAPPFKIADHRSIVVGTPTEICVVNNEDRSVRTLCRIRSGAEQNLAYDNGSVYIVDAQGDLLTISVSDGEVRKRAVGEGWRVFGVVGDLVVVRRAGEAKARLVRIGVNTKDDVHRNLEYLIDNIGSSALDDILLIEGKRYLKFSDEIECQSWIVDLESRRCMALGCRLGSMAGVHCPLK